MSIAKRLPLIVTCALGLAALALGSAAAHPVAQGAMEVVVSPERVTVTLRVSMEEVLVAAALSGLREMPAADMIHIHGDYLLAHFRVAADGRRLHGIVVKRPAGADGRPVYELEYPFAGGVPARIVIEENVLREFDFAPGNPWEASYVTRASLAGTPAKEGMLLTAREPLVLDVHALASGTASRIDMARMAKDYIRHGIIHILSGYDHLLFIAALALAVATWWDLVRVISAFTLAHSITLTLSVLNVVRLPSLIVEPMIAASIVFVALQNVIFPENSRGAGRVCVAFFFGLFHGLGFAGGLLTAMEGIAGAAVGLAILAFSLGVEIGHQVIVLPIFFALKAGRRAAPHAPHTPLRALRYGSAGIFVAGVFYLISALIER